jgi:hypothetical protein
MTQPQTLQELMEKQKALLAEQNKPTWECYNMEERSAFEQLLICVLGPEKSGKSRLVATIGGIGPVLVIDLDKRKESISGLKNVFAITLQDPGNTTLMPTVVSDIDKILTLLETSKKKLGFCDLHVINPNVPEGTKIFTIAYDSIRSLAKANLNYILYQDPKIRSEISVSPTAKSYTPKDWRGWRGDTDNTQSILARSYALGLNVIFVAHTRAEEAENSTQENPLFTGRLTIDPPRYKQLLGLFNEVWLMELVNVNGVYLPKVRVKQGSQFNAATCLELDPVQDPNICDMIQKHIAKRKLVVK